MNRFAWTAPESEPRLSKLRPRAGHEKKTVPESNKRDVEREDRGSKKVRDRYPGDRDRRSEGICGSVKICASERNWRSARGSAGARRGRRISQGWANGWLVSWLAWSTSGCPGSFLADWCSGKVRTSSHAVWPGSLLFSRPSAHLPSETKG